MGEFCGDCKGKDGYSNRDIKKCPGQWYIDLSDGTELPPECGLLEAVVIVEEVNVRRGKVGRPRYETVITEFPNPLIGKQVNHNR